MSQDLVRSTAAKVKAVGQALLATVLVRKEPPFRGLEMGGGGGQRRHRDAKHPVKHPAAAPSARGAPFEKHHRISLRGARSS